MSFLDILHAVNPTHTPSPYSARLTALGCITFALILHGTKLQWGLRVQNILGAFKVLVLAGMAFSGLAALAQLPGFKLHNVSGFVRCSPS